MGRNDIYTLYIGNNITKFDHLSLNIRLNNRYYKFSSYILNITSKFVEFFRTNTFYVPPARKLVFSLQFAVAQCSILRYRGIKCKN